MPQWAYGPEQDVKCPVCGEITEGLDWTFEGGSTTEVTGARVQPCDDFVPMPPYAFGPTGSSGTLKFTKTEQ